MTEYIISRADLSAIQRTKIDLYGGVELVRCRDCKEYAEWGDSMICMRLGSYYGNTNPNDFCSRAERKDNETY